MISELDKIAIDILEKIYKEDNKTNLWENSKYEKQRKIQIDKRGSVGERFFAEVLFKLYPRRIEYNDGDQGDWDLKISGIKFEIKTSSIDVNKKFQNEGLKIDGDYEGILFLGITPNQLYIKFMKKNDIDFSKLHNRGNDNNGKKATGAGYKYDLKEKDMLKVKSLKDIENEFEKQFSSLLKTKSKKGKV
ncbi:MAG: hypothetical protein Ta2D_03410 [Rickettsiales bacterium]|nr:MAG: hypothetical protein Ta2D_03410 [Rickettsiales bacterium]